MHPIRKHIVTDEDDRPIAVQVDYQDWIEIERLLSLEQGGTPPADLSRYSGVIQLTQDPLEFQTQLRGEWS